MTENHVAVRMYRGILGDCFLIKHVSEGEERFILIDCGVLQGVKGGRDRIVEIARDVQKTCSGVLDLLVVTHEHADHLSGFGHASDIFFGAGLEVRKLWLAWTENDQDKQAQALRDRFGKAKKALKLTASLAAHGLGKDVRVAKVAKLQDFVGFDADEVVAAAPPQAAAAKKRWTGAEVIKALKSKAGDSNIEYLEPGDVKKAGAGEGLRVFVLGPPRDEARLKKDLPSSGAAKEVYLAKSDEALSVASAARAYIATAPLAAHVEAADDSELPDPSPFAQPHQRSTAAAEKVPARLPGGVEDLYYSGPKERSIELDWLDAAEALALKMDSDTNNTSLVLALELPDRQVLLFAADAQVGNWMSWGDQTYPAKATQELPQPIVVDDILSRVTLYKVGHHASHNATLRDRGLEKMSDERLVAMIPVVEEVAKAQQWKMPYPELEERLLAKTGERVIRGDNDNLAREREAFASWPHAGLRYEDPEQGGLWVEITIPKPPED